MDEARLVALLERMAEDMHAMRDDVHAIRHATEKRRGAASDDAVAKLLREIAVHAQGGTFTSAEIIVHARLPLQRDLHDAIVAGVGAANARRLGKLFASIEGRDIAGLRVVRVDTDAAGIIWALE